jgi:hypothetical protein
MKCKIQWVCAESGWRPTPDDNEAVALVTCDHIMRGMPPPGGKVRVYPICKDHLAKMGEGWMEVYIEGVSERAAEQWALGYEQWTLGYKQGQADLIEQIQAVLP